MSGRRPRAAARPVRLSLEVLEDRCTPTAFSFSTGNPNGLIATASRPSSPGQPEIETADDFVTPNVPISATSTQTADTVIDHATFTGLMPPSPPGGGNALRGTGAVRDVVLEIYAVFPAESNPFRTPQVPTRANSPSDVALESLDARAGQLSFTTQVLSPSFTAANSVVNGINPAPNQHTGGEGPVTGQEVQFNVTLNEPLDLPAGHYFFVPQVQLANGTFLWLSAPKPIVAPGTPFAPDLQTWIRNEALQPDWLRVGTDIVGGTAFNAAFSLSGEVALQPHISSISPASVPADQSVTLTVFGSNFTSLSHIVFNADKLPTRFISDTELQAVIPGDELVAGAQASISVTNPSAGHPDVFADDTATLVVTPAVVGGGGNLRLGRAGLAGAGSAPGGNTPFAAGALSGAGPLGALLTQLASQSRLLAPPTTATTQSAEPDGASAAGNEILDAAFGSPQLLRSRSAGTGSTTSS